ncbi:MAG: HAMP domain-containing histidine kinase [Myxococcales bacterium]|nr:MAG: HAMP domain-containing histidine kinase [Myxococcales bacterium]
MRWLQGHRYYLVLQHDLGYVIRNLFPALFRGEASKHLYNVVDANNRRMFGVSLSDAGDYVVGRRFPTTLYAWRLQIAPKHAPQLQAKGRTRRYNEVGLLLFAFAVVVMGVSFLLYAVEKERKLNIRKTEFLANVSHELKTPLSIVRMFSDLLRAGRVPSEEKRGQYLEIICKESERLSTLIDNVLDFSALESGKQRYEMRKGNLGEVVLHAVETFRYRIEREGIEIRITIEQDLPLVAFDHQAILLAVINLLDNAAKYGGGTAVDVGLRYKAGMLQLSVADEGPGIPKEDIKRVFERFFRSRSTGQVRGSGIGLSLVRYIAEAHGGQAWARNKQKGGAKVGFSIPVSKLDAQEWH